MILSPNKTLLEDITAAKKAGFTEDFMYQKGHLIGRSNKRKYAKKDCKLIESCRHEGLSNPSDASILFLIECTDGTKGCLSSAYGVGADTDLIEFVLAIKKNKSEM
ncbi:MAG: phosphoribosylpyrophosphate synthetase [Saprospiraceae bacterium]